MNRPDKRIANLPPRPKSYDKKVALVLQGGGALGSYQAGAYEALSHSRYLPDWVAGISIGAINAALIAGNAPADRVARLREFWDEITAPSAWWPYPSSPKLASLQQTASANFALMFGQPGFFSPRTALDWLPFSSTNSYYSTSALKTTLERLIDFDRINNARTTRLSLGAVNVRTGQFAYFDSDDMLLRAEHIMASGALPPGFPPVEIEGEQYWDGGLVSNTPLKHVLDQEPRRSRLTFQIDLFHGRGALPENLEQVSERAKDIQYASRTRRNTDAIREKHEVRHAINELFRILPPDIAKTRQAQWLYAFGCVTEMDIVQLIYRPDRPQGATKDYEFSRPTMLERWKNGFDDAMTTLQAAPWLDPLTDDTGVRVFDAVHAQRLAARQPA